MLSVSWINTRAQGPFKTRVSGTLQNSELPADATISFPKPLPVLWNNLVIGYADMKATYGVASQAEEQLDNVLITPTSDHDM